jgi:hypothetical protein
MYQVEVNYVLFFNHKFILTIFTMNFAIFHPAIFHPETKRTPHYYYSSTSPASAILAAISSTSPPPPRHHTSVQIRNVQ